MCVRVSSSLLLTESVQIKFFHNITKNTHTHNVYCIRFLFFSSPSASTHPFGNSLHFSFILQHYHCNRVSHLTFELCYIKEKLKFSHFSRFTHSFQHRFRSQFYLLLSCVCIVYVYFECMYLCIVKFFTFLFWILFGFMSFFSSFSLLFFIIRSFLFSNREQK